MRKALYRSYRPRFFREVEGQETVCAMLKNQIAAGRAGHAYLFTGIRGTGKTSLAKIFAKAINCPNTTDGEPCGECSICRGIDSGSVLDVSEIDAASNTGVDNIRDLREESAFSPVECQKRIYIIDEAHMLSPQAWAALLKILEEPPAHLIFIFATTDVQKVPATILSRCQRYDLKRISIADIVKRIRFVCEQEGISISGEAAELIARLADGALRDALSILETCASGEGRIDVDKVRSVTGIADKESLASLCAAVARGDEAGILSEVDRLYHRSMDPARLCVELMRHLRCIMVVKLGCEEVLSEYGGEDIEVFRSQSSLFERPVLHFAFRRLKELSTELATAPDKRLALELALLEISDGPAKVITASAPQKRSAKTAPTAPTSVQDSSPPWEEPSKPQPVSPVHEPLHTSKPQSAPIKADAERGTGPILDADWQMVIDAMEQTGQRILWSFLVGSKAFLDDKHLRIKGSELLYKKLRENAADRDLLRKVIREQLGINRPIGPYKEESPHQTGKDDSLNNFLEYAREKGIPVEEV